MPRSSMSPSHSSDPLRLDVPDAELALWERAFAADEAARELSFVWDAVRVQPKYKYDDLWPAAEFDVYRWIIARAILKLQDEVGLGR